MNAVEMKEVCRSFGSGEEKTLAVDHLSLCVPQGSVFGLLGANGAGKTTSLRMMLSHLKPDSGEIRVLGENPARFSESTRKRIAYISENMQIPQWMSIEDAIGFSKPLYPKWNDALCKELLKRFDLSPRKRYDESSKGQKRAICIIIAMSQEPDILIMDEPASGLDTLARRHFLSELVKITCDENKTVIFSSHILGDIERTVDSIAILTRGHLILEGELDLLKENVRKITIRAEEILPGREHPVEKLFQILRKPLEYGGTDWVVKDYTEEKFAELKNKLPENAQVELDGFNLEELFMESLLSDPQCNGE